MRKLLIGIVIGLALTATSTWAVRKLGEEFIGVQQIFWQNGSGLPEAVTTVSPLPIQGAVSLTGLANPLPVTTPLATQIKIGGEPFQVTCTTSATQFDAQAGAKVACITSEEASGGAKIYIGKSAVSTTEGDVLHPQQAGCYDIDTNTNELYCIVGTGTADVSVAWYVAR